jgi:hypothetical protein
MSNINKFLERINIFLENWAAKLKTVLLVFIFFASVALPCDFRVNHQVVSILINFVTLIVVTVIESYVIKGEKKHERRK